MKKYDLKLLIKQGLIAGCILVLLLIPWTIRNYKLFHKFIPLTYGMGNPLLLGTYQGYDYPLDEELDYSKIEVPEEMKYYLDNLEEEAYMRKYYSLEYDGLMAKYRMKEWWEKNPKSMLKSYFIYKPYLLVNNAFYWKEVLGVTGPFVVSMRKIEIVIFSICTLLVLINRSKIKEWIFLMLIYAMQVALYAYTFAFSRYAISMFFIRYIVIGLGLIGLVDFVNKRRKKV